jgi:hypothetical protein
MYIYDVAKGLICVAVTAIHTYIHIYRLTTVSSLHMHIGLNFSAGGPKIQNNSSSPKLVTAGAAEAKEDLFSSLIKHFEGIQEKHTEFRLSLLRQKSLLLPNLQPPASMAAGAGPGLSSSSLSTTALSTAPPSTVVGLTTSGLSLGGNST